MKTKRHRKHHISVHQRVERLCHHRAFLAGILFVMGVGLVKYETHASLILQPTTNPTLGYSTVNAPHHEEITRMPIQYGSALRPTHTSSE